MNLDYVYAKLSDEAKQELRRAAEETVDICISKSLLGEFFAADRERAVRMVMLDLLKRMAEDIRAEDAGD